MTEAWFLLAFFATAVTMPYTGWLPFQHAAQGSSILSGGQESYATERECLDDIPARIERIKQIHPGYTIPEGALGFVCVRGVRR